MYTRKLTIQHVIDIHDFSLENKDVVRIMYDEKLHDSLIVIRNDVEDKLALLCVKIANVSAPRPFKQYESLSAYLASQEKPYRSISLNADQRDHNCNWKLAEQIWLQTEEGLQYLKEKEEQRARAVQQYRAEIRSQLEKIPVNPRPWYGPSDEILFPWTYCGKEYLYNQRGIVWHKLPGGYIGEAAGVSRDDKLIPAAKYYD